MLKSTIKITILLVVTLFSLSALAVPRYSNVIFFGDSLSDIGNFPMAKHAYLHSGLPATVFNLYGMYYIPVSNPVNLSGYKLSIVRLFGLKHKPYAWPSAAMDLLPTAPKINSETRQNRSYSWTEFFITDAEQDGLLASNQIVPSVLIQKRHLGIPITYSVDYAFANATSTNGCNYKSKFKRFGACTYQQIEMASDRFSENSTLENYEHVLVPGLQKQIQLFKHDVLHRRVKVGDKTLYSIWIGGNDLLKDLIRLKSPLWKIKLAALKNLDEQLAKNNEKAVLTLINTPAIKAKNIVIFGFFNPVKIVPAFHGIDWIERVVVKMIVNHYNDQLKQLVQKLTLEYPKVHLQYENAPLWYKEMSSQHTIFNGVFNHSKMGQACQLMNPTYNKAVTPKANCKGYLFWNAVHPASSTQQLVGYFVERSLIHSQRP